MFTLNWRQETAKKPKGKKMIKLFFCFEWFSVKVSRKHVTRKFSGGFILLYFCASFDKFFVLVREFEL